MKKILFLLIVGLTVFSLNKANAQITSYSIVKVNYESQVPMNLTCVGYQIMDSGGNIVKENGLCFARGVSEKEMGNYTLKSGGSYILKVDYETTPWSFQPIGMPTIRGTEYKIFSPGRGCKLRLVLNDNLQLQIIQEGLPR